MNDIYDIKYISRQAIDPTKWDACINSAANGLIYGYSHYLDRMAEKWDGLILGDYEAVMPLTWKKKWGIRYCYQPCFTQQLGIFSIAPLSAAVAEQFMQELESRFAFAEIFLNYGNTALKTRTLIPRDNYILDLNNPYQRIREGYSEGVVRNLKKAAGNNLRYHKSNVTQSSNSNIPEVTAQVAVKLFREQYGHRFDHVTTEEYERFEKLCLEAASNPPPSALQTHQSELHASGPQFLIRSVCNPDSHLLAVALLGFANSRLYLLMPTTLSDGRKKAANHFLLDNLISEFAGTNILLDFEGSDLPGVARFYKEFGAALQPYFFYRYNKLPWPLRLFK